jgi:hypothetical protein
MQASVDVLEYNHLHRLTPKLFDLHGMYVGNFKDPNMHIDILLQLLRQSKAFQSVDQGGLREKAISDSNGSEGRYMVHQTTMKANVHTDSDHYPNILDHSESVWKELADQVVTELSGRKQYPHSQKRKFQLEPGHCQTTFFKSVALECKPQTPHSDVLAWRNNFNNQIMILLALQDGTEFCICKGTHKFDSYIDMMNRGGRKFFFASKLRLQKGQFVAFHPKCIHFGWTCTADNYRIHYYLGKQPVSNNAVENDNSVKLITGTPQHLLSGVKQQSHIVQVQPTKKQKRFENWNKNLNPANRTKK